MQVGSSKNNFNVQFNGKGNFIPNALVYLGKNDGEILNTCVTTVGTGVVAPIFIAGNPLSKEDKETKWYSALRQPISAVIAFIVQLYINKSFNNFMANRASLGKLGEYYDLHAMPLENHLKRIIKLEHPDYTKEQIAEEIKRKQNKAMQDAINEHMVKLKDKKFDINDLVSSESINDAYKNISDKLKEQYKTELEGKSSRKIEKFIKKLIKHEDVEKLARENVEKSIKNEVDNLLKTSGGDIKELTQKVKIEKFVRARAIDAKKAFSSFNKWSGIAVSLVTLPFTCGILNWVYPRVMEKVMPKIQPWIHRKDPNWSPEKAKKYGPSEKIEASKIKEVHDENS